MIPYQLRARYLGLYEKWPTSLMQLVQLSHALPSYMNEYLIYIETAAISIS